MIKEFVTYEQALSLKELGFDEPCIGYYDVDEGYSIGYAFCYSDRESQPEIGCSAPTFSQAFRWFRDKHSFIGISTISNYSDDRYVFDIFQKGNEEIYFEGSDLSDRNNGNKEYNTYEEAESACLDKLIEIVKNKQDE